MAGVATASIAGCNTYITNFSIFKFISYSIFVSLKRLFSSSGAQAFLINRGIHLIGVSTIIVFY